MDTIQLKKLQKDYLVRVKNFDKQAMFFAKSKEYAKAIEFQVKSEVYAICARDIKSLLDGKVLFSEDKETLSTKRAMKILKSFRTDEEIIRNHNK